MRRPIDIQSSVVRRVSMSEYESDPDRTNSYMYGYIRESMSDFIAKERVKESRDDFYKEYRLDLYVATPKEFWKIVEREAQEIASRFK